ncbi:MAG: hypothetical protein HY985_13200, partial [Magnetospirillum sp.]|nr:hypothetical protein [Magnetospirillum sp.]
MCRDHLLLPRRRLLGALPLLAMASAAPALLAACGQDSGPVTVRWGKENCEYCGMIIDDPRFAAQVRGGPGRKVKKFD